MYVTRAAQYAEQRTLQGSIGRDFFGDTKNQWRLEYANTNVTDYETIKGIYDTYVSTGVAPSFECTEDNYTIASVQVHMDIEERGFTVKGSNYISDFTIILKEV